MQSYGRGLPLFSAREILLSLPFECLLESVDSHVENARLDDALVVGPMKDKSSGANSKETFRLSPGCSITFANRLSRFIGGVTLANRSFKYS